jgi:hypothetical protein
MKALHRYIGTAKPTTVKWKPQYRVLEAMVPGFVIRYAVGKMSRGRGRKRERTRDMRGKNVKIARRQNVAACDDGVRAVGNPTGRCIKMTDIVT